MSSQKNFSCPDCGKSNFLMGDQALLFACLNCHQILYNNTPHTLPQKPPPPDWSIIQLNTTGTFDKQFFTVVGRIRMQMRKDYKNYWCIWLQEAKKYAWVVESLGFYAFCDSKFFELTESHLIKKIKSYHNVEISKTTSVKIDDLDFCESISYEGEIGNWSYFLPRFQVAQGKSGPTIAAFFHYSQNRDFVKFMIGEWVTPNLLNLQQTNTANEW